MSPSPILQPDNIKNYIARITELDTLSINSRMPIDKLNPGQRQTLYKQFNKYIQPMLITKSTSKS
jgi:hypothetical protein